MEIVAGISVAVLIFAAIFALYIRYQEKKPSAKSWAVIRHNSGLGLFLIANPKSRPWSVLHS